VIEEAEGTFNGRPWWRDYAGDRGQTCPTCARPMRVYKRRLRSSMARSLVRLYRLHLTFMRQKYFHVKQFDQQGARGEFGVLRCWGLVEDEGNLRRPQGMWAVTAFGRQFVELRAAVPLYVLIGWRSEHVGFAGPMVDVRVCLEHGGKFHYDDLMAEQAEEGA
jgi:hypothetical protein